MRLLIALLVSVLLLFTAATAQAAPSEAQLDAALTAVKKDKRVMSAAWNSKTLPSLLVGVDARGKAPGAFNSYALGFCGTLAAQGISGAFVRVMDNNAAGWVELAKVECPETPKVTGAAPTTPAPAAVQNLAGKSPQAVAAILGKPKETEKTKRGPKMTYVSAKSGVTWEIVYIEGKADWITITPSESHPVPFDERAITAIGLPQSTPERLAPSEIRWANVHGLRSVVFFPNGKKVGYCYVKAATD
ncbi:MAG: hypothetical protein AB9900_12745 [Humidesulfovibrio sp.]